MDESKCKFSYSPGEDKDKEGTFVRFSDQTISNDNGQIAQQTMAIILKDDGNIIEVEPSCVKIIESK